MTELGLVLSMGGLLVLGFLYLRRLERSAATLYWAGSWSALFAASVFTFLPMGQPAMRAPASFLGTLFAFLLLAGALEYAGRRAPRALLAAGVAAGLARAAPHLAGRSDLAYLLVIPLEVPALLLAAAWVWRAPSGRPRSLPEWLLAPVLGLMALFNGWDAVARSAGVAGTPFTLGWAALMLSVVLLQLASVVEKVRARERALLLELERARKLETLGRLVGGVAHDFNNQLTVILGNARLARDRMGGDPDLDGILADLTAAAERCADLTDGLLAFSRKAPRAPRAMDVGRALEEAARLVRPTLPERARLDLHVPRDVPRLLADATQLHRVLVNLAANACDAIAPGGRIEIEARRAAPAEDGDARVEIEVRDDGAGMDEDTRAHLFDPFFTTKPPSQGTGLGLSIVLGVVESHGGSIEVDSAPGRGTRFLLRWPAADPPGDAPAGARAPGPGLLPPRPLHSD